MKNSIFYLAIITSILGWMSTSSGCVSVETKDSKVDVSPSGIHVEDEDGSVVDVGPGGVHVEDEGGDEVDVSGEGIQVRDNDGDEVDVNREGVRVESDRNEELPENWPDEITLMDGFKITQLIVEDSEHLGKGMVKVVSTGKAGMAEIAEYYQSMPGWQFPENYPISESSLSMPMEKNGAWFNVEAKIDDQGNTELSMMYMEK